MNKQLQHYRDVRYICGNYMTVDIIPVFRKAGQRRSKAKPTSDIQEKVNQRHAEEKIFRLAHANFDSGDLAITLTYDVEAVSVDESKKDVVNYLRRIKRKFKKDGLGDLKYLYTTEIGKKGRIHHHLIVSGGLDRDEIEKLWGKGFANTKRLRFTEAGIIGLTKYMVKQRVNYRRWSCSKNLIDPEGNSRDYHLTKTEVKDLTDRQTVIDAAAQAFDGWEFVDGDVYKNSVNAGVYVKLLMRRKDGCYENLYCRQDNRRSGISAEVRGR